MKLTRIFGIVLGLHVGVILLVMMQPGCQSAKQGNLSDENSSTSVTPDPLDSFNEGTVEEEKPESKPAPVFVSPTRPKPGEIIIPGQRDPVDPAPTVDAVAGVTETIPLVPSDVTVYKIQRGDTLWGIARKNQLTMQQLLTANPNLSKESRLSIGQEIMIPENGTPIQSAQPIAPPTVESGITYIVKSGDSLSKIARDQGVSVALLMQANRLNSASIIRPGLSLIIPEQKTPGTVVEASSTPVPPGAVTHTVKKGDNLTRIAAIYGVSIKDIMQWNNLADAGRIRVGQSLVVSEGGSNDAGVSAPVPEVDNTKQEEEALPAGDNESLENFFKGNVEERPVVELPEN